MTISKTTIGYLVQLGGIAGITLGAIFSVHHIAIGAAFLGGAAAFYVGEKIRKIAAPAATKTTTQPATTTAPKTTS
jgi:hypothetical protein